VGSTLFPAGLIVETPKLNIEEIVQHFLAWDLKSKQMGKGLFSANITAIHTPHIQFHDVNYSHGFLTQGTYPDDCVMIGYTETEGKAIFQNRLLQANELVISTCGGEIDYLSSTRNRVFTISVEKQLFKDAFFDFFAEPFESYQAKGRFFIKPQKMSGFLERMAAWISFIKNSHALLLSEAKYSMLELEILKDIFSDLSIEQRERKRSGFQVEKARDILHASLDERFDPVTFTQELGISQRQLQRTFRETYGYTPKRYLLNLRINEVRQELLQADPETATISSIALKYYFFDLSHFTKAYKALFGELPSQTLQR